MAFTNVKLTILYGSQTGNSQDVAERIWRESKRYYFTGTVCAMDDFDVVELIHETCVIFVCSTTGQGEEPDNMKHFWKFLLQKKLAADSLINLKYAVLGLGDSSYVKFNFAAKRLNKRLQQLGAQMVIPLGLGDDQHDLGYDATSDLWIDSLWNSLQIAYPIAPGFHPLSKNQAILPRWAVDTQYNYNKKPLNQSIYYSTRSPKEFFVSVKENKRVTHTDHFQDVRLIKLKTNGEEYKPGDVIVLRPRNLPSQVKEFHRILRENEVEIYPHTVFQLSEIDPDMPVPPHLRDAVTFQQLCEEYFDLTAIPRRHTFSILAQLTDSDIEREKCEEFTTAEGQDDLYNYCNRPRRNITEVLSDFRHATKNLTKEILFELLQPIKPRDFSIASSCKYHKNEVHILVAVVKYKTKLVKERLGLCSNYLAELKEGDPISVWFKKGSFRFPENPNVPIIMVGPGTGVAPFRNYIYECLKSNAVSSENLMLFFGCRSKEKDFYCKEDYELHERKKLHFVTAFSRDQEYKIYVQHKILEHANKIWKALSTNDAYIFIAGNAKNMPQEVKESFVKVCITKGDMSEKDAVKFIENMERLNRYQTETWC